MTDNTSCASELSQRRQLALYNRPLPRFSLTSPYPYYTKSQLDMRRKVEILKHDNNKNTKTNNLTKNQQWSMFVNGKTQNTSKYHVNNNSNICL